MRHGAAGSGSDLAGTSLRLVLRDLEPADTEAALALWLAAWSEAMPAIDFAARRDWFGERLAMLRRKGFALRCATAPPAGDLQGFVQGCIQGFIAISPALRYLDHIAVLPGAWGTGVAATLIGEAKRLSPRGIALDVNQDNLRAVGFYEKHGFRRLRAGRNPRSGLPTWWYAWGEAEPPPRL